MKLPISKKEPPVLDAKDLRILQVLQENARFSTKDIADQVGMSVTRVYDRIRKMEKAGLISQYVAIIDPKKIGRSLAAFVEVRLNTHERSKVAAFEKELSKQGEVQELHHMSGEYDYLVKVVCADMDAFSVFMSQKLGAIPGIASTQSFFVLNEAKRSMSYDLSEIKIPTKK